MKLIKRKNVYKKHKTSSYIKWRFLLVCIIMIFALLCIILRITYLQLINYKELIKTSNMYSLRIHKLIPTRGIIMDRNGNQLAVSVPVYDIYADPKIINSKDLFKLDKWDKLSNKLMLPLKTINQKIHNHSNSRFIYLARQVNENTGNYINNLKIHGIFLKKKSRRYYPYGPITAHLIGITDIDGYGIEGVEKSFNDILMGINGKIITRKDKYGKIIEDITCIKNVIPNNLMLSIDKRIQLIAYNQLIKSVQKNKAKSGTVILIDINSGEILAMTNTPSYNPNNYNHSKIETIRNRAITDLFEPGSTVKPMVIITALHNGIITPNSVIKTIPYVINGHQIKDVTKHTKLTITEIIQKSSNIGVSKLALSMPITELLKTYSKFGLGHTTNIGLIGENKGILPQKKTKWSKLERATFSFGYGLMVTPLQLARIYAIIGSYGIYRPLSIIKVNANAPGTRIFPKNIIKTVIHMMESVALPGGAGAIPPIKDYTIAIKTGTVKKIDHNGHYTNKYIAYTAGIAPASNPRIAMIIVINEPNNNCYYGGTVSAPIFGKITEQVLHLMNIQPDKLNLNQIHFTQSIKP